MSWIRLVLAPSLLVALVLPASPAAAEVNVLVNRNFGADPLSPLNGWVASGTGVLIHDLSNGYPLAPSARFEAVDGEWLRLRQCTNRVVGGGEYHLEGYSFTYLGSGDSFAELSVTFFAVEDCIGPPLATSIADQLSFPSWALAQRSGIIAPEATRSARVEIDAWTGPGGELDMAWDAIALLPEPGDAAGAALAALGWLACRRTRRPRPHAASR